MAKSILPAPPEPTPAYVAEAGRKNYHIDNVTRARLDVIDLYLEKVLAIHYDDKERKEERIRIVDRFAEHDAKTRQ